MSDLGRRRRRQASEPEGAMQDGQLPLEGIRGPRRHAQFAQQDYLILGQTVNISPFRRVPGPLAAFALGRGDEIGGVEENAAKPAPCLRPRD